MVFNALPRNWAEVLAEGLWPITVGGSAKTCSNVGE
jgi:hypothetical protein